jgi:cytochrome c oxidase cbb3-type subunit 3
MKSVFRKISLLALFALASMPLKAQEVVAIQKSSEEEMIFWILAFLIGLTATIIVLLIITIFQLLNLLQKETNRVTGEHLSLWERFLGFKPKSQEHKLLLDEDFDGIKELDNPIPAWFNWFFGVTIAFAVLYLPIYHVWKVWDLQDAEYEKEVKIAEIKKEEYLKKVANSIDEKNVKLITDASQIQKGAEVYKSNCATCHGQKGEGLVGPNLTDEYWLYGGKINDIFKTIKYGTQKGMPGWQKQLNPLQIQLVSSYIHSLKGTNPPNAKEPQGTKENNERSTNNEGKAVSQAN